MFNISEYKAYLSKTGTLPTNRFFVDIPIPRVLFRSEILVNNVRRSMPTFGENLSFRAESVRAPGVSMQITNVNRYGVGPMQKFPFNANFTDTSITFLADKESLVWIFFYNWLNNVFSYSPVEDNSADYTRYRSNYMVDYAVDTKINIYDYDGNPSTSIELIDSYPISMNDIPLSWGDNNQLKRITVTFAFRHWRMTNVLANDAATKAVGPQDLVIAGRGNIVLNAESPDPTQNHLNKDGKFNQPTIPGGTYTPGYAWSTS